MALPRAHLESLLRARRLDQTLTTALPEPLPAGPNHAIDPDLVAAATGVTALDAHLGGGFPRGHVSEVIGRRSSGRASLVLHALAASTARGELTAVVDALDMFDVESAAAAGVDLNRVLWVRGHVVVNPGMCRDTNQRALEQAMRAFALILQAGNFGLVVFDAAEAPADALRRLPFTTWLRLQRMVEGSTTACVLVGSEPMARSAAGLSVRLADREVIGDWGLGIRGGQGSGRVGGVGKSARFGDRLFEGLDVYATVARARAGRQSDAAIPLRTVATYA